MTVGTETLRVAPEHSVLQTSAVEEVSVPTGISFVESGVVGAGAGAGKSWIFGIPLRSYSAEEAPLHLTSRFYFEPTTPWGLVGGCAGIGATGSVYVLATSVTSPWDSPLSLRDDPLCLVYGQVLHYVDSALKRETFVSASPPSELPRTPVGAQPTQRLLLEIIENSQLSMESVARLMGVARRTVYNWASGSTTRTRPAAVDRIRHLHAAVSRLADSMDPWFVGSWIKDQEAALIGHLADGRWKDLAHAVDEASAPAPQLMSGPEEESEDAENAAKIRAATHKIFLASPAVATPRRATWRPKEVTGLGDHEDLD